MFPDTAPTIPFPSLGSFKDYDFIDAAARSEKLLTRLEDLIKESEAKIKEGIDKFHSSTKDAFASGPSKEADKLVRHATANRSAAIRREEMKANAPKRDAILEELKQLATEAKTWAPIVHSPEVLLQRTALSVGDQKRIAFLALLEGSSAEDLNAYALTAIGENNLPLAAALGQHLGRLPKDRPAHERPGFTARSLAEVFVGEKHKAIQRALEVIEQTPPIAVSLDRAYRTGQREPAHAMLTRAAARLSEAS